MKVHTGMTNHVRLDQFSRELGSPVKFATYVKIPSIFTSFIEASFPGH